MQRRTIFHAASQPCNRPNNYTRIDVTELWIHTTEIVILDTESTKAGYDSQIFCDSIVERLVLTCYGKPNLRRNNLIHVVKHCTVTTMLYIMS